MHCNQIAVVYKYKFRMKLIFCHYGILILSILKPEYFGKVAVITMSADTHALSLANA